MKGRPGRVLLIVAAFVLFLVPVAAIAGGSQTFSDVPPTDWAFADVEWVAAAGVTQGCGDGTTFCPDDSVTRREMAAFMHRLGENQVVDAGALGGFSATELVSVAGVTGGEVDNFTSTSWNKIISVPISAPVDGFIHIVALAVVEDDYSLPGNGMLSLQVRVNGTGQGWSSLKVFPTCSGMADIGCGQSEVPWTFVKPVTAGYYTVAIYARESGDGSYFHHSSISTLFTPNSGVVVAPASSDDMQPTVQPGQ